MRKTAQRMGAWTAAVMAGGLIAACAGDTEEDGRIEAWRGESPHFLLAGTLDGESLDLDMSLDHAIRCEREYEVPVVDGEPQYAEGRLVEFKVNADVTVNGEARIIELEFKRYDFQGATTPTEVRIVPRVDGSEPAADAMWLEWEWHDAADETTFEVAAQTGSFQLEHFTGTPGDDGLVIPNDEGSVGGVFEAQWSETEDLTGSFTVPCGESAVEMVEEL